MDEDFIRDGFNLYALKNRIPNYNEALKMILSDETPDSEYFNNEDFIEIY